MPGLFGAIKLHNPGPVRPVLARELMQEMAQRLCHSANEAVDLWIDETEGVAVGRVRNRDLPSLAWPRDSVANADHLVLMDGFVHSGLEGASETCNGRTTSALELAKSMNGSFALATISLKSPRRFDLATDRRGSKPIFYVENDGWLFFAPEVKALLAVKGLDLRIDHGAIGIFFGSGFVLSEQTFFSSVRRLPGGNALVVQNGTIGIENYYRFQMGKGIQGASNVSELERTLAREIRCSVDRIYEASPSEVVFLSGGVDSRAILASACEIGRRNSAQVRTVSWYAEERGNRSDLGIAKSLAEAFDLDLRLEPRSVDNFALETLNLSYVLDGLSDIASFHSNEPQIIHRLAGAGITRVLRGDESFGWRHHSRTIADGLLEIELRSLGQMPALQEYFLPSAYRELAEASDEALGTLISEASGRHPDDVKDEAYFNHRLQRYLGSSEYFKTIHVEHRNPLLDERLLDLIPKIPRAERRDKNLYRRSVRAAFPEFWTIPISNSGNLEDYSALMRTESAVRRALRIAVEDLDSGIWKIFNRRAVANWLEELGRSGPQTRAVPSSTATQWLKSGLKSVPVIGRRIRGRFRSRVVRKEEFFLRFLVLKNWVDLFVDRRGGREDLAACQQKNSGMQTQP